MTLMQKIFTVILASMISLISVAQMPGCGAPGRGGFGGGQRMNIGHFYGKVVDSKTSKGVDAASVQLTLSRYDTATKKTRDSIVSGMLTRPNGDFTLENLPVFGNCKP